MSFVLYNMLKKVPPPDGDGQVLRARMRRYLEGPLPSLASGLQASAKLSVVDASLPEVCAWWRTEVGAWVGLPASSLDFLALFHALPDLPSGPDGFWARLAADRPLAFSRAAACEAPGASCLFALTCLIQSADWHMLFCYSPCASMRGMFLPVPSPARDFAFECALAAGFLPLSALAGARRGDFLFPGWSAKDSLWIGRYDTWLPLRFSGKNWEVAGEWSMKPTPSDHFPLEISVELGRIRLRGRDLDALVQGAVLPLGVPAGGEVHLVSDNRVLARGELVVAGGELAVRLLSDVTVSLPQTGDFSS